MTEETREIVVACTLGLVIGIILILVLPAICQADSWIFDQSTYTHRGGERVSQYETHVWVAPLPSGPREEYVYKRYYFWNNGMIDHEYRLERW